MPDLDALGHAYVLVPNRVILYFVHVYTVLVAPRVSVHDLVLQKAIGWVMIHAINRSRHPPNPAHTLVRHPAGLPTPLHPALNNTAFASGFVLDSLFTTARKLIRD